MTGRRKVEGEELSLEIECLSKPEDRDVPNDDFYWFPTEIRLRFVAGTSRYRIEPHGLVPLREHADSLRVCRLT